LLEALLHGLAENSYRLNRLRYDLRKLKGHTPLQRDGSRYAYRLTGKGLGVALLFLFFHKQLILLGHKINKSM
jgi:hypothetical protein